MRLNSVRVIEPVLMKERRNLSLDNSPIPGVTKIFLRANWAEEAVTDLEARAQLPRFMANRFVQCLHILDDSADDFFWNSTLDQVFGKLFTGVSRTQPRKS